MSISLSLDSVYKSDPLLTSGVKRREVSICILFLIFNCHCQTLSLDSAYKSVNTDFRSEEERVVLYFVSKFQYCTKSLVFFGKSSDFHAIFTDLCYILWNPLNLHYYLSFFWFPLSDLCTSRFVLTSGVRE